MTITLNGTHIDKLEADWEREIADPAVRAEPERLAEFTTSSGVPLKRVYSPLDLERAEFDFAQDVNYPGAYPFTRGVTPSMYRNKFWVMGMYSGYGSAEEANRRYRMLLQQGQTGFSIALDLPSQCGYDADHPLAAGEVGKVGVHLGSLEDMELLFDGIPLEQVRQIRTTANSIGAIMLAMYVACFEKQGTDPRNARMFIQNDVLKEYIARGTYIYPPDAGVKLSSDVIEYCARHLRAWTPLAMSGYHIRDSGSTAAQEVGFTFANALAYVDDTLRRGLSIDDFAPQLFTFLGASMDFLEEVAKFRAARRVWARLMRERYGAQNPESMKLRIFAYTLGGNLTAQQPLNNVARVAIETLAAVLGGVQTIATSSFDEALSIPTDEAVTVALRTQQIVAHEAGVTGTVDALGGSYMIESLTTKLEHEIMDILHKVESLGGAVRCVENGYYQGQLADAAYRYQRQIEANERIIVGVNAFTSDSDQKVPIFEHDRTTETRQVTRLRALRQRRDNDRVRQTLADLRDAAQANENVIPALIPAVKAYATLGEMCATLRQVYGEYVANTVA